VRVDAFERSSFLCDPRDAVFLLQPVRDLSVEDLPRNTRSWFRISPPYQA